MKAIGLFIFIILVLPAIAIVILMVVTEREKPFKTKVREAINAAKEVNNVPTLPKSIECFHNWLPVWAFRVLGGICAYLSIKGSTVGYGYIIAQIINCSGAIFLLYMTSITLIRLVVHIKNWIQGKYSARNSPKK